ncbi:MAG: hypothetical protein AAGC43_17905 [Bacteroidota bacterium]
MTPALAGLPKVPLGLLWSRGDHTYVIFGVCSNLLQIRSVPHEYRGTRKWRLHKKAFQGFIVREE